MIIWINGAFGAGKTQTAYELHRRLPDSYVYDPENIGYFIRKNLPPALCEGDFQDYPMWRERTIEAGSAGCSTEWSPSAGISGRRGRRRHPF